MNKIKSPCCDELNEQLANKNIGILYNPKFREIGININDGGTSYIMINYCPWCGTPLPASLREKWFDIIFDELELEPDDPLIPSKMKTDEWWLEKKKE